MAEKEFNCADWYTHESQFDGRRIRCVRSRGCDLRTYQVNSATGAAECARCAGLEFSHSYQQACYRLVEGEGKQSARGAAVKEWMQKRKVARLVAQLAMEKALTSKLRGKAPGVHITAASLRGSLRVVGRRLQSMANEGLLVGKDQNALQFVANITTNLAKTKGPRGNRHNALTQAVMGILRKVGGERVHAILSENIGGLPCESTSRAVMCGAPFNAHLCDADFERIAHVYGLMMERLGLQRGSIPCLVAEDETAINPNPQWDQAQDAAIGFCDVDCERKCVKVTTCRADKGRITV